MKTHRAITAHAEPSTPHHLHSFGSYKHSLAPLHTSSTISLPGNRFCITTPSSASEFPTNQQPTHTKTLSPVATFILSIPTHRKHNHNFPLPFDYHRKVIPHLEPSEGLVYEYISDLRRRYEARVAGEEVGGGEGAGLDAEGAEG